MQKKPRKPLIDKKHKLYGLSKKRSLNFKRKRVKFTECPLCGKLNNTIYRVCSRCMCKEQRKDNMVMRAHRVQMDQRDAF